MTKDCKAPGGNADPKKDAAWAEYRKRREAAIADGTYTPRARSTSRPASQTRTAADDQGDANKGQRANGKG